ncbi:MAG: porin, partial [Paracoccaceae bacterium]
MKKILFATTALVATTGMAAADVTFGGYGRFGILYVEDAAKETRVESRLRLNINASATSDNGLEFNALVRLQADDTGGGGAGIAG